MYTNVCDNGLLEVWGAMWVLYYHTSHSLFRDIFSPRYLSSGCWRLGKIRGNAILNFWKAHNAFSEAAWGHALYEKYSVVVRYSIYLSSTSRGDSHYQRWLNALCGYELGVSFSSAYFNSWHFIVHAMWCSNYFRTRLWKHQRKSIWMYIWYISSFATAAGFSVSEMYTSTFMTEYDQRFARFHAMLHIHLWN